MTVGPSTCIPASSKAWIGRRLFYSCLGSRRISATIFVMSFRTAREGKRTMSRSVVPGAEAGAPWPPRRNDCLFLALNRFERLIGGEQVMVNPSGDVADWMRVEAVRGPRSFRRVTRAFAAASNHRQEDLMDMEDGHDERRDFLSRSTYVPVAALLGSTLAKAGRRVLAAGAKYQ